MNSIGYVCVVEMVPYKYLGDVGKLGVGELEMGLESGVSVWGV